MAEQLTAATAQLTRYRSALEATGGPLKLQTHAVVCIGLERLVFTSSGFEA